MAKKKKENALSDKIINWMDVTFKLNVKDDYLSIADEIEDKFEVSTFTGQKRTVVPVGSSVLKLISSREGLEDNVNALITSERLRELYEDGDITEEDLELFALVEMANDDPYVIKADKYTLVKDSKGYKEWKAEHKDDEEYRDDTSNSLIGNYLLSDKNLNRQLIRILKIIGKWFNGSDILAWKVPENYGISEEGNLVLIDMGSILPKYKDVPVLCEHCGVKKVLLVVDINYKSKSEKEKAMDLRTGLYCCTNADCQDHSSRINTRKRNNNVTDSCVFDEYMQDVKHEQEFIADRASKANIFLPTEDIESFSEFRKTLFEESGEKFDSEEVRIIWTNSIPYILNDLIEGQNEVVEDEVMDEKWSDFEDFREGVYEVLDDIADEDDENELIETYIVLLWLKYHILKDNSSITMFDIIKSENKSEFLGYLEDISVDEDDYDDIWEIVASFIKSKKK